MKKVFLAITILAASSLALVSSSYALQSRSPVVVAQKSSKAPLGDLSKFRVIAVDTLTLVKANKLSDATIRVKDLETLWDNSASKLQAMNRTAWRKIDVVLDDVFGNLRIDKPTVADCTTALETLIKLLDSMK